MSQYGAYGQALAADDKKDQAAKELQKVIDQPPGVLAWDRFLPRWKKEAEEDLKKLGKPGGEGSSEAEPAGGGAEAGAEQ